MSQLRILHHIDQLKELHESLHLALGVFDGVHLGHQAVIGGVVDAAASKGGFAGVVTFSPHPIQLLAPAKAPKRLLASLDHKVKVLEKMGVDFLLVIAFTHELASQEPEEFIDVLLGSAPVKTIAVGEDWLFGKARRGNAKLLGELAHKKGFELISVPPVMHDDERISSTRIRQAIRDGNLDAATTMLGRPYTVYGKIVRGKQLGRTIGFPTANIFVQNEQLPRNGVWAVNVQVGDVWYKGIANLGFRPTVEDSVSELLLEIHLFEFAADIYDQMIEVQFLFFVREEMKFSTVEELISQIHEDVEAVEKIFNC